MAAEDEAKDVPGFGENRVCDVLPEGIQRHTVLMMPPTAHDALREFLLPLRTAYVVATPTLMRPVVLFVSKISRVDDLSAEMLRTVTDFEEVYIIFGDHANNSGTWWWNWSARGESVLPLGYWIPLTVRTRTYADLVRVGIDTAQCCVILSDLDDTEHSDNQEGHNSYAFSEAAHLDTKTVG